MRATWTESWMGSLLLRFSDTRSGVPRAVYVRKKPEKLDALAGFAVKQ